MVLTYLHVLDHGIRIDRWPQNRSVIQWEFQDPIHGGTLVPYFWPYFVGIFPAK